MRKSKRFAAVAFIATFGLIAAACGDDEETTSTTGATEETGATESTVAPSDLKLGVAFDTGGRGDGTFNDAAGRGADQAAAELGATVQEIEATVEDDRKPNLEALTAAGNNPVIVVGFAFAAVKTGASGGGGGYASSGSYRSSSGSSSSGSSYSGGGGRSGGGGASGRW